MTIYTAAITLILVMDPVGNIPVLLSILKKYSPKRRTQIILRESIIAFIILAVFLFLGQSILKGLHVTEAALSIAGGIILFIIALKMMFPDHNDENDNQAEEPFIVPLAIPLIAGPSALATVLLFVASDPSKMGSWFIALIIAVCVSTVVLLLSNQLEKILGKRGLIAMEKLMGMILTTLAVQMFLRGVAEYFLLAHIHT